MLKLVVRKETARLEKVNITTYDPKNYYSPYILWLITFNLITYVILHLKLRTSTFNS